MDICLNNLGGLESRDEQLEQLVSYETGTGAGLTKGEVWAHLTSVNEKRQEAIDNISEFQQDVEKKYEERRQGEAPSRGDLVLLRRFVVDKDKGRKLETRWEGPYKVKKVGRSGVSVTLEDIHTGRTKGRYSFDSIKIYVRREEHIEGKPSESVDLKNFPTPGREAMATLFGRW